MPMLLKSEDGKEFELAVIVDRLPEAQDGFGDDETPTFSFRVATEDQQFEETAPALGAHELQALAEWLERVAGRDAAGEAEIELLEPELNFQVLKEDRDGVNLRVRFHLSDVPEELGLGAETSEARHVDLKLSRETLLVAAGQLRADIEQFAGEMALKDDLEGDEDLGLIAEPEEHLGLLDDEREEAPGAGSGEDNAGDR